MKRGKTLLTSLAMILLTLGLSACEQEGPAQRAGEKVDKAMERAGEATEERSQQ